MIMKIINLHFTYSHYSKSAAVLSSAHIFENVLNGAMHNVMFNLNILLETHIAYRIVVMATSSVKHFMTKWG